MSIFMISKVNTILFYLKIILALYNCLNKLRKTYKKIISVNRRLNIKETKFMKKKDVTTIDFHKYICIFHKYMYYVYPNYIYRPFLAMMPIL